MAKTKFITEKCPHCYNRRQVPVYHGEPDNNFARHIILYAKGHYKKSKSGRGTFADLKTMRANWAGVSRTMFNNYNVYNDVVSAFVQFCNYRDVLKILGDIYDPFWHRFRGKKARTASMTEVMLHMLGMLQALQVYGDDKKTGKLVTLLHLPEPDPKLLPIPKANEKSEDWKMIVRDLTLKKADYKGHPCYAVDAVCPCRPCYICHDCTPPNPAHSKKFYSDTFHCAVNWNNGCPQPKPEPVHILNRQHRCKRCGQYVKGD